MKRGVGLGVLSLLAVMSGCGRQSAVPAERAALAGQREGAVAPATPRPELAQALSREKDFAARAPADAVAPGQPALPIRATDSLVPSMIIRTGQAEIEVDSLEPAIAKVEALAARVGGFVGNSSIQSGEGQRRQATLQLKVPALRYAQALTGLGGIGRLVSSTTEAQDVGEEYVDVTARMSNARRLEERLLTLLATRTGKLEDVLSVEQELARVREEVERFDGRLRYLRANVAVSTLAVTVAEPGPVVGQPGSNVIADAFRQAWRNFVTLIAGLIAALGILVPMVLLVLLAFLGWRRWGKRPVQSAPSV